MFILALIGLLISAGTAAYGIYNSQNGSVPTVGPGGGGGSAAPSNETPEERKFFEMQTLQAENASMQLENATTIQANASTQAANWIKFAAIGIGLFLVYQIFKRKGYFS